VYTLQVLSNNDLLTMWLQVRLDNTANTNTFGRTPVFVFDYNLKSAATHTCTYRLATGWRLQTTVAAMHWPYFVACHDRVTPDGRGVNIILVISCRP
jgi:hypothetical protein